MSPSQSTPPRQAPILLAAVACLLATGCATRQVSPGPALAEMTIPERSRTLQEEARDRFVTALKLALENTDSSKSAAAMDGAWRTGVAYINLQCNAYIDGVGLANQAADNERRQTSLVGGLTASLMGLNSMNARDIAGVAAAFSFAGSSMDTYTSSYLFSDAAKSITRIVRESQAAFLTSVADQGGVSTLHVGEVVNLLVGYQAVCRPAHIRAMVDELVANGSVQAEFRRPAVSDGELALTLEALRTALGRSFSEEEGIQLYAWSSSPANRSGGRKLSEQEPAKGLLASLTPATAGLSAEAAAQAAVAELDKRLRRAFLGLSLPGSRLQARWSPAVATLTQAEPAPPATPASATPAVGSTVVPTVLLKAVPASR